MRKSLPHNLPGGLLRNILAALALISAVLFSGSDNLPPEGGKPVEAYLPADAPSDNRPFIAKNVILLIGDGMGFEHIRAGGMYLHGEPGTLAFEDFPYFAVMTTDSMDVEATDSGASATAMATGRKVSNYVISQEIPGDGDDLYTLLEYASDHGMSTGLVTTSFIYDATPAAFGAHTGNRNNHEEILADYLNGSRPNVLLGGGNQISTVVDFFTAGYTVVLNRAALLQLDTKTQTHVAGLFGEKYMPYESEGMGLFAPHLPEMAATALEILDNDPDGFFAVIEGGLIDVAAHGNKTAEMVGEVAAFHQTTQAVMEWAEGREDTLIVVMSDHETGGLRIIENRGAGNVPEAAWGTEDHTDADVGVWVYGRKFEDFPPTLKNTEIPALLTGGKFR